MEQDQQQVTELADFNDSIAIVMAQLKSMQTHVNRNASNITKIQADTTAIKTDVAKHDQRITVLEETICVNREHNDASIADIQRQLNLLQRSILTPSAASPPTALDTTSSGPSYVAVASSSANNTQPLVTPAAGQPKGPPSSADLAIQLFGPKSLDAYQQQKRYMTVIAYVPLQHITQTTDHKTPSAYSAADFERDFRKAASRMRFASELPAVTRACFTVEPLPNRDNAHARTVSQRSANKADDGGGDDTMQPEIEPTVHYHYVLTFTNDLFVRTLHERYAAPLAIHMDIKLRHNLIQKLDMERKKYQATVYPLAKKLNVGYSLAANGVHPALRHPFSREYTQVNSVEEALRFLRRVEAEQQRSKDEDEYPQDGGENGEEGGRNVRQRVDGEPTPSATTAAAGQDPTPPA